jgi:hypothetical protein
MLLHAQDKIEDHIEPTSNFSTWQPDVIPPSFNSQLMNVPHT